MSFNGSGAFTINTSGQPVVTNTVISSTAFNLLTTDLATGLSTCILKDGTQTTTAVINFAAGLSSPDNVFSIKDNVDATKIVQFQCSGITAGNTRTLTVPDASTTIVGTDATQTLTNKTLTSPTLTTPAIGVATGTSLVLSSGLAFSGASPAADSLNFGGTSGTIYWQGSSRFVCDTTTSRLLIGASTIASATSAGLTVTGVTNSTTGYQYNGTALPFQTLFTSSDQTITAAGALTLAHGLSATPKLMWAALICQSADGNWATNDVVQVPCAPAASDTTNNYGMAVFADATNINVRFGSQANVFAVINKTTGVTFNIDITKWKVRFYAA